MVSFLQEFAISNWLDLDDLVKTVDFYLNTGHSEDEVRRLLSQESEKLLNTYHSVATLRRLAESR